jgi:RHS repeat-associated protein
MLQPSRFAVLIVFALFSLPATLSADTPICKTTCSPNPGSSTYGTTIAASTQPINGRGTSSPFSPEAFRIGPRCGSPHPGPKPRGPVSAGDLLTCATVNGTSQSVNYAIPILNLPGRDGLDLNLTLYYEGHLWTSSSGGVTFNADRDFPSYGFQLGFGFIESETNGSYKLTEPDGTKRLLNLVSGTDFQTTDASYIDWNSSTLTLTRKDGSKWVYQQSTIINTVYVPIKIEDTNGNYISITYDTGTGFDARAINTITDTLGRIVTFNYDSNQRLTSITGPAFGGGSQTYGTFTWSQVNLNYNFSVAALDSLPEGSPINVITACSYPNGTGYQFVYGDWGIVVEFEKTSSGGAVMASAKYDFPTASTKLSSPPAFSHQTVFDGVNTAIWTYSVLTASMKITDPYGTAATTTFLTSGAGRGLISSMVIVNSANTTLRTTVYDWTFDSNNYPLLADTKTTLNDSGQQSQVIFSHTTYANVSETDEYDFGPTLVRKTLFTYLTASAYTNLHIYDRATNIYVKDASNNTIARSDLAYDQATPASVTGATNHDDVNYGSTNNVRGNLTQVTRYTSASNGGGGRARTSTFNTLGDVLTAKENSCQLEQWSFSSTTQYAYPDNLIRGQSGGPQFTTTYTYDFGTGLTKSIKDENGQTTSFTYDSMSRLLTVIRPDQATIATSYNDSPAEPTSTLTSPLDTSRSVVQQITTNGVGHAVQSQTSASDGSVTPILVQTSYDLDGRVAQTSSPYYQGGTPVYTVNAYDALGRVITVTPPGNAGSYQYSYSGSQTILTDPAGIQRGGVTDSFGRLVQALEPGYSGGQPATGSVTISGSEQQEQISQYCCKFDSKPPFECVQYCPIFGYDFGTVSIIVGGLTATASFGQGSTASSIATALASAINGDESEPVTASASGGTVNLTAKQAGSSTDYSLSAPYANNSSAFPQPSFTTSPSGIALSGGTDGTGGSPSLSTPQVTYHFYDALNDSAVIIQGQQTRQFVYDSMGELLTSNTPEAGLVSYTYTVWGKVATRTDARGVVTTYSYDSLNRLTQVAYNDGKTATVGLTYDQGGLSANANDRLTTTTDGLGSETYLRDAMDRITKLTKTVNGTSYPIQYAYNSASMLTSLTYPSGRLIQPTYDGIGRIAQMQSGGINYLSIPTGTGYNAAGEPTTLNYGNGLKQTATYNSALQLASLAYANSSGNVLSLTYNYGTGDNRLIQSITDSVDSGRTANYTYDALGRLNSAVTNGSANYPAWGLSWSYDRYGNRLSQNVTAGSAPMVSLAVNPATNHITSPGYGYDASGNMTADGLNVSMTFDGENHLLSSTNNGYTTTYAYDGKGIRVEKTGSSGSTIYLFSGRKVIAEYALGAGPSSPTTEYIYAGEKALASISAGTTIYYQGDQLSNRLLTDSNGNVLGQRGNYPFGEQWYASSTTTKWQFTSYERDPESTNDYALARYDVNHLGRFLSADPFGLAVANVSDPQTLNLYTYVRNNPIGLIDPTGTIDGDGCDFWYGCMGFWGQGGGGPGFGSGWDDPGMFGGNFSQPNMCQGPNCQLQQLEQETTNQYYSSVTGIPLYEITFMGTGNSATQIVNWFWQAAYTAGFDSLGNWSEWSPDQGGYLPYIGFGSPWWAGGTPPGPIYVPKPEFINVYLSPYQRYFNDMSPDDRRLYQLSLSVDWSTSHPIGVCGLLTIVGAEVIVFFPPTAPTVESVFPWAASIPGTAYGIQDPGCD